MGVFASCSCSNSHKLTVLRTARLLHTVLRSRLTRVTGRTHPSRAPGRPVPGFPASPSLWPVVISTAAAQADPPTLLPLLPPSLLKDLGDDRRPPGGQNNLHI